jgi:hypothetical protein
MSRHILAALVTSAVLFIAVTPVSARTMEIPANNRISTDQGLSFLKRSPVDENYQPPANNSMTPEQEVKLREFVKAVTTGEGEKITGLFVPEYGGFYVIQQPDNLDGTVSPVEGVLTQFNRPSKGGVIGLLAHNFAAGKWFNKFEVGDLLYTVLGNGETTAYRLTEKVEYRAIDGKNVQTDFVDLTSGSTRNVDQVYQRVYTGKPHLTLQTCLQQGDDLTWGRLFLLADPIL